MFNGKIAKMLLDDILRQIGEFGTWQKRIYVLGSLYCIPWAWHAIASVFLSANTDYWCAIPTIVNDTLNCTALGFDLKECEMAQKNLTIPSTIVNGKLVYEQCERYNTSGLSGGVTTWTRNATQQCDEWDYDRTQYKATVVQDVSLTLLSTS